MSTDIACTVVAIDPGSWSMGAAIVSFDGAGKRVGFSALRIDSSAKRSDASLRARYDRISDFRDQLQRWLRGEMKRCPFQVDVVAYERPFARGAAATACLWGSVAASLTVDELRGRPTFEIATSTAKAVYGGARRIQKGERGRDEAKAAAIAWAEREFGYRPGEVDDATADALAVACAAAKLVLQPVAKPAPKKAAKKPAKKAQEETLCLL